jgi:predicted TPR repeat methyltransferase
MNRENEMEDKLSWIYSVQDNRELAAKYAQWAKDYDAELERDYEWRGPQRTGEMLVKHVPRAARILDAGAGTGLMGVVLRELGYDNLVAMDLSVEMLDRARKKDIYREYHQMVMGEPLAFASDSFDAVVSTGVLTTGHAPPGSLDELVRINRPGGHILFTLRTDVFEEQGFKVKQQALEAESKWKLVEASEPAPLLLKEPDVKHQIWVYRVIA